MVIEWLKFQVAPELREAFIQKDEEVWTEGLKKISGYLGKEVWIDPDTDEVIVMIRWESMEVWKSIPKAEVDRLNKLMGNFATIPIVESRAYQVRRFQHI
jgi:uncharacterized protein (TIGR03792 family)